MSSLRGLLSWLNKRAGWLSLAGLGLIALRNWRKWLQDRALAIKVQQQKPERVVLKSAPRVSVLVAAWNEAQMIERHIESFLALRYPHKELVLCAGGEDGTYRIAEAHASVQVAVLEQHAGEGKQRALGRCLGRATGEIIFLTDADCLLGDEAFERTIDPLVSEGEAVATGTIMPRLSQLSNPFVLHQWFTQVGAAARRGGYVDGILGGNVALRRSVLQTAGGFDADVRAGTDYYLAKQVLRQGYRIRHVPDSAVKTPFPETFEHYRRQHTRWLRNVVVHGLRFGSYSEVLRCFIPSILGILMLTGPLAAFVLGPVALVGWLLIFSHALLSRVRYVRFGEHITGCPFPKQGYMRLPLYLLVDFATWAGTLFQYLSKQQRAQW